MDIRRIMGRTIKAARLAAGMSQEEVTARMPGLRQPANRPPSRIEKGVGVQQQRRVRPLVVADTGGRAARKTSVCDGAALQSSRSGAYLEWLRCLSGAYPASPAPKG